MNLVAFPLSGSFVAVAIAVGAGLICLWIDVRFPALAPSDFTWSLIHVGVATALAAVVVRPGMAYSSAILSPAAGRLVGVFGVAFPALLYCLLASLWVLKALHGRALQSRR